MSSVTETPHLTPQAMAAAQRHLVAKILSEFTHERLVQPRATADGYELAAASSVYRWRGRELPLEHHVVEADSVRRLVDGAEQPLDAQALILELRDRIGMPDALIFTYLEEIASTLSSAAYKRARQGPTAARLVEHGDFQEIERSMTEGHPSFIANNGRVGFGAGEFARFAPETGGRLRLVWLAARREDAHLALGEGLDEETHYARQLDDVDRERFERRLTRRGASPDEHLLIPVHPWQWENRIAVSLAPDLAAGRLVFLGEGTDEFQPQQSIRTLMNVSRPECGYTKLALSIQNMGFQRGMSPAYMRNTPAINDFAADLVRSDPELRRLRFDVLRERATVGYTGDVYHRVDAADPHRRMLAALWRESPFPMLGPGETLATMAALLHRDHRSGAVVTELVRRSGISAQDWIRAYLQRYLVPLLHLLDSYAVAFMPHTENLVMVLKEHVPAGMFMKDIGEEVAVLTDAKVPQGLDRIVHPLPPEKRALSIFTDVYDGVFRHLAAILDTDGVLPAREFWSLVAESVDRYGAEHPDRRLPHDWWATTFRHSCLNRLQLRNTLEMVDLGDQSSSLIYAGTLWNPAGRSEQMGQSLPSRVS